MFPLVLESAILKVSAMTEGWEFSSNVSTVNVNSLERIVNQHDCKSAVAEVDVNTW